MNGNVEQYIQNMVSRIPHGIERKHDGSFETALAAAKGEILSQFGNTADTVGRMQTQLDALDLKIQSKNNNFFGVEGKSLEKLLEENEPFQRLRHDGRGRAVITLKGNETRLLERKTTITSGAVGYTTPGVLMSDHISGITAEARTQLTIRDVLYNAPTEMPIIDFVKVSTPMSIASPAPEGTLKAENAVTFSPASTRVRTIATWIKASKQILDDWKELSNFLDSTLSYYVDLAEEKEVLFGDGTGEHLSGLVPQASNFNTSLLPASGYNRIDQLGYAMAQIEAANELPPDFIVLNPMDYWRLRLSKDGFGNYIMGPPQENVLRNIFMKKIVTTSSIATGTFLVGSGSPAASQLRTRMETVVDISTEDQDNFVKNLVTVRAEKRVALVVERPASYVYGSSFNTSPIGG